MSNSALIIQRDRRSNARTYNLEEHDMIWWASMTYKLTSENTYWKNWATISKKIDRISGFWQNHLYNLWVFIYLKWWSERPRSTSLQGRRQSHVVQIMLDRQERKNLHLNLSFQVNFWLAVFAILTMFSSKVRHALAPGLCQVNWRRPASIVLSS